MKKILLMALTGLTFFSAEAQKQNTTGCKIVTHHKKAVRHHGYAENFPVCKNDYGYHICGEAITYKNSTKGSRNMPSRQQDMSYTQNAFQKPVDDNINQSVMIAPQSQSYPSAAFTMNTESSYEGYYPQKHYMTVSYSNSVAEETRAPYEGLPSPQDDGPSKNAERNLNESNPNADLAPITGSRR
jgi:hypothetical protein